MASTDNQRDTFSMMAPEILLRIFDMLSLKDLLICSKVCKYWYSVAQDEFMWYKRCREENIAASLNIKNSRYFWKDRLLTHTKCCSKWRGLNAQAPVIFSMNYSAITTDLVYCGSWAACSLVNGIIIVIDITSNKLTLKLHDKCSVWALVGFKNNNENFLASGGNDGVVRVWNIATGSCVLEMNNNTQVDHLDSRSRMIRCLAVSESESYGDDLRLVSGGRNFVLFVWDVVNKTCVHVLQGHRGPVRCVRANTKIVVSGSYDSVVLLWDLLSGDQIYALHGHTDRVYNVYLSTGLLISSSLDTTMRVWNINTGQCLHTLIGHSSVSKDIAMGNKESCIISANADCTIKVWDVVTGRCSFTVKDDRMGALTSIYVVKDRFIVGSTSRGVVTLWNLQDGTFIRDILSIDTGVNGDIIWKMVASDSTLLCATGSSSSCLPTKLYLFTF